MPYRGAIVDVDGTILRGTDPVPGARAAIERLAARGIGRLYVSNNPTKAPPSYAEKLRTAGFEADAEDILTAGSVTTRYLVETYEGETAYVIGEDGLLAQFREAGIETVVPRPGSDADGSTGARAAPPEVGVAVVSIDREFTYDTLTDALSVLRDGSVPFVGTDPDVVIPAADGDIPGSGAIVDAVASVAERDPEAVLGKPHDLAREMALDRLGVAPEDCLVVGDRLDTDIALGDAAGMTTVLVKTGVTDEARLARSPLQPDYVLDSIADIDEVLDEAN